MGFRIDSQNNLSVQKHMGTTHIEDRRKNSACPCSDNDQLKADAEAKVTISDAGRKLFDETGKSGKWLSDEELIEKYGALPEEEEPIYFQYGYNEEFDSISSSFRNPFKKFITGRYAGTGIDYKNIDYVILDKMAEKYSELRQNVETNFTDVEKEQRLSELDLAYKTVFENNIVKPIRDQIENSMSFYNRGTLTSISGSQSFIDQYYTSEREMNATYKKLGDVNEDLNSIFKQNVSQWSSNKSNAKYHLINVISTFIDITGTSDQKKEFLSMTK